MNLTDKVTSTTHRVVLYGEPKSGKTELAGRLAEHFDLLWFDLENGYITLTKLPQPWQKRIELISIPDTKLYPIAADTMLKVIKGGKVVICEEHGKVACPICTPKNLPATTVELGALPESTIVVVDSLTQLGNSIMSHITRTQPELYKPEWTDYRSQGALLDTFLSQIQQSPYNIICITHEVETDMEDGKKKLVPVAGTTTFSRNTGKYFDHIVRASVANKKHGFVSSTTASATALSGSRTDIAIEKDAVPSLLRIFKPELYPVK